MINELDTIVLTVDLPPYRLRTGDIGAMVLVAPDRAAFEVEFVSLSGDTIALVSLAPSQVRAVKSDEIASARVLA
jgi:hypothetical protein